MTASELRAWMSERGWSVRRLASALDVMPSTVQRWRDGHHSISTSHARVIQALGKDITK